MFSEAQQIYYNQPRVNDTLIYVCTDCRSEFRTDLLTLTE